MALVSDAGMPLISDPGYKLLKLLYEHNIHVDVLPGACSIINGLVLSNMPSDKFSFYGFMRAKGIKKKNNEKNENEIAETSQFFLQDLKEKLPYLYLHLNTLEIMQNKGR